MQPVNAKLAVRQQELHANALARNRAARHPKNIGAEGALALLAKVQDRTLEGEGALAALEVDLCIAYCQSGGKLHILKDTLSLEQNVISDLAVEGNRLTCFFLPEVTPFEGWEIHTFKHVGRDYTYPEEQPVAKSQLMSSVDEMLSFLSMRQPFANRPLTEVLPANITTFNYRNTRETPYHFWSWTVKFPCTGVDITTPEYQHPRLAAAHVMFKHFWPKEA
jgi:hypothetical protein